MYSIKNIISLGHFFTKYLDIIEKLEIFLIKLFYLFFGLLNKLTPLGYVIGIDFILKIGERNKGGINIFTITLLQFAKKLWRERCRVTSFIFELRDNCVNLILLCWTLAILVVAYFCIFLLIWSKLVPHMFDFLSVTLVC